MILARLFFFCAVLVGLVRLSLGAILSGGKVIEGAGRGAALTNEGAPVDGTDEMQTITIGGTPTGGTFTLTFDGHTTDPISWTATDATLVTNIDTALEALSNIDTVTTADSTLSSGIGDVTVTFSGTNVAKRAHSTMTADASSLTGTAPTVDVAETTAGVTATALGAPKGAWLIDITNGDIYANEGTADAPTWEIAAGEPRIRVISDTVDYDDFTDGGGAAGTYDLSDQIPVGAVFLYSKVKVTAGFAGDTSAVLTIGDGTDADRYNTGTPSVFATAANGVEMGDPSGNQYHAAVATPRLTVTSNADFTSVSAGTLAVSLYYIDTE